MLDDEAILKQALKDAREKEMGSGRKQRSTAHEYGAGRRPSAI
jgi:hypothetical protein